MTEGYIRTNTGKIINATTTNSKKLIEIIEVDDYVNGYRVISVDEENDLIYCDTKGYETSIHSKEIKEILTKEAYLDNCYDVKQNDIQ